MFLVNAWLYFQLSHGQQGGGREEPGQLRHLLGADEGGAQAALRSPLPQVYYSTCHSIYISFGLFSGQLERLQLTYITC